MGRHELHDLHSRGLALVGWSDSDGRCRASWSCAQGCGVHVMPCGEGAREVRALVMATSCDVCHVTQTQGDMTMVSLSMPKQKMCSRAIRSRRRCRSMCLLSKASASIAMRRITAIGRCCCGWSRFLRRASSGSSYPVFLRTLLFRHQVFLARVGVFLTAEIAEKGR